MWLNNIVLGFFRHAESILASAVTYFCPSRRFNPLFLSELMTVFSNFPQNATFLGKTRQTSSDFWEYTPLNISHVA